MDEYPIMFNEEENVELFKEVKEEELNQVIKSMKGDKSLGPDGWTVEFFAHFIDIFQEDLLQIVEESRKKGYIHPHLNSTYISFIPKKSEAETFTDYRPISLCNLTYKIISKIIENRLKVSLSKFISPEQYEFLNNRIIHDSVVVAQECMHNIK